MGLLFTDWAKNMDNTSKNCCSEPPINNKADNHSNCCHDGRSFDWLLWTTLILVSTGYLVAYIAPETLYQVVPQVEIYAENIRRLMNKMAWALDRTGSGHPRRHHTGSLQSRHTVGGITTLSSGRLIGANDGFSDR